MPSTSVRSGATHPLLEAAVLGSIEDAASRHLGRDWSARSFVDLDDRASHRCGVLHGEHLSVFAKLSSEGDPPEQLDVEVRNLGVIRSRTASEVPALIGSGTVHVADRSVLLLEALVERSPDERSPSDWRAIGHALAGLHRVTDARFGLLDTDGYFGPLPQDNRPVPSNRWADFFVERRLLPYLRAAVDSGHLPAQVAAGVERTASRGQDLCGPEPVPALLHGDAQQNNFVSTSSGAVLVDVAPYFGHPEVDLAAIDIFTPVPPTVIEAYLELLPLDPDFGSRRELWRTPAYLAVIAVDGASRFGRPFVERLARAVDAHR